MPKTITHQFTIAAAPEVVWEYLINSELLTQWLMPNDIKAVKGHNFMFGTKPRFKLGFDGRIYCEVLESIPAQKLVYSWKGGMSKDNPSLDSVVTWTLNPVDKGTVLSLKHEGFKNTRNLLAYMIMNKGWIRIGKRLTRELQ